MRTILIGTFMLALGMPSAASADEPAKADQIAGLIRALSSSKFTDRDKADRELRRIGEPALKQLKEAAQSRDYEVRERAFASMQVIQQKVENDKLLLAPMLRLQYDKTPLQDAIADLTKKTGIKYQIDPKATKDSKQPVTLDTGEVPYWEAVEKFLAATGLTEVAPPAPANVQGQTYYDFQPRQLRGGAVRRYSGPQPTVETVVKLVESKSTLSAATSTLIRVKALPKEAVGNGGVKGSNQLMLHLEVTPAPALLWQGVVNVDIRKVVDDRGALLAQSHTHNPLDGASNTVWIDGIQIIQQGQAQIIIQGGQGNVQVWSGVDTTNLPQPPNPRHVPIALLAKDSNARILKELDGIITAEVLTGPQPIVVLDNILKAATKDSVQKAEYRIEVVDRSETDDQVRLRIRVRLPVRNDFIAFQARGARLAQADNVGFGGQAQIQLQDASGKVLNTPTMQLMEQSFDGISQTSLYSLTISKKASLEPARLVVVGRRLATVGVSFALKNVPLP